MSAYEASEKIALPHGRGLVLLPHYFTVTQNQGLDNFTCTRSLIETTE